MIPETYNTLYVSDDTHSDCTCICVYIKFYFLASQKNMLIYF